MEPSKWVRPALTAGTTASQAFVASVAAAVEQIGANEAGLLASRDPEYLHQLRVGLRRLRSTLRAFRGLVRRRRASAYDEELQSTLRILGEARDWDEFSRSGIPAALRAAVQRHRNSALYEARAAVGHRRFKSVAGRMLRWADGKPWRGRANPGELIGSFGARALRRMQLDLSRSAKGIDWADGERRHRVRIRAKRLRYALDCFASGFAFAKVGPFRRRLRGLQEVLGELNDCRVQRSLIQRLSTQAASLPAARLDSRLAARERRLIGKAAGAWSKFSAQPTHWRREAARARA